MEATSPRDIALAFVERINAHDIKGLCSLMTEDHLFTDSLNTKVRGRENMRGAWLAYFHMIPDFAIELVSIMSDGQIVGLFGRSRGTFSPDGMLSERNRWEMPSAWRAVVRGQHIAEWQVFADNEPVRQIMADRTP
jgi:ketosteroid isomerase-like protein